jgi:prepilin-type N-terminal cleavage/methylation domain-containing protein
MKRKGFTLVELLVVIAIIALLMGILMPALAQVRRLAQRIMCGTNLSAIGKACIVYANDNDEDLPRAGGRGSEWSNQGKIAEWDALQEDYDDPVEWTAFGDKPPDGEATITSCFYLLIKYTDGTPKLFVCKGDVGTSVFKLTEDSETECEDLGDAHDFGDGDPSNWPGEYCSYAYQHPFKHENTGGGTGGSVNLGISVVWSGGSPLASDRNPYLDKNAESYIDGTDPEEEAPSWTTDEEFYDPFKTRNSASHQREGQNVLYTDSHVEFEKAPNVGIENDCIWLCWQNEPSAMEKEDKQFETAAPAFSKSDIGSESFGAVHQEDAFLVNEYNGQL